MKKIKVVFQGDSITDAGRDKRNYHHMGNGYPKYAAQLMQDNHPEIEFEFINQGISGNRTCQLFDRLYPDALAFEPDIISILIGINDIWHRYGAGRIATTNEQLALNYRCILREIRAKTNAKIVILAPFILDCDDKQQMKADLPSVLDIVRELADEFADVYIPTDKHFEEALKTQPEPKFYSGDGVHPNANGSAFIGKLYADAVEELLK